MKPTTLILAVIFAIGGALVTSATYAQTIRIATEGAYAPYNFKDSAGNLVGFEIDLSEELCARMNAECELVEQAWDGIIPALQAKKYDAIMAGMSITAERQKVISFSRSYVNTPIRFATLKGSGFASFDSNLDNINLDDVSNAEQQALDSIASALDGLTVGVQTATTHENFMNEFLPGVDLKSYDTMDNMILDLEAGRVDVGYTDVTFLAPVLEKNPDVMMVGPGMTGGPLGQGVGVGIRQEDGTLRERFSDAINSTIADGTLSRLAVEWFEVDISSKN